MAKPAPEIDSANGKWAKYVKTKFTEKEKQVALKHRKKMVNLTYNKRN